jgi:spermidine/putrescine transport system ATP-binding protein
LIDLPEHIVRIRDIWKSFGKVCVLENCSVDIEEGEFVTLLGPSGCGKTTLLRIIAGFESCDRGYVEIRGQIMGDLPPHKRPVNMVFQRYALFPHLNVYENIAFGLRLKKVTVSQIRERVKQVLDLVQLPGFEGRNVQNLSGGESQRVALARAIVNKPRVLLLDEPLAALDLKIRKAMQEELKQIHSQLDTTFVYVTHDQEEALAMSDRIVVICNGNIVQIGSPFEVYYEPTCLFSGQFVGESNIFKGHILELEGEKVEVDVDGLRVKGRLQQAGIVNQAVTVLIRPEMVQVKEGHHTVLHENMICGTLVNVTLIGGLVMYQIETDNSLLIRSSKQIEAPDRVLKRGELITAYWQPNNTLVFIN